MSECHIVAHDEEDKGWNVVFHYPVKAGRNKGDRPWKDVIKENFDTKSILPNISAEEQLKLTDGLLREKALFVRFSSTGLTFLQKSDELKSSYLRIKKEQDTKTEKIFEYSGKEFDFGLTEGGI